MLNWLRQVTGSFSSLQNLNGYGKDILDPLAKDLARLEAHGDSLPAKAMAYVVDGIGGDVPELIRKRQTGHYTWTSQDLDAEARQVRWRLYEHWDTVPADFWIRFGSVLAADSPVLVQSHFLGIGQHHPWIEALALDLAGLPVSHLGSMSRPNRTAHPKACIARLEDLVETSGLSRSALAVSTFQSPTTQSSRGWSGEFIASLPGFQASTVRDVDLVRGAFRDKSFENRLYALRLVNDFDPEGLESLAEELVALSLDSSAKVRAAAMPLALRAGARALEIARLEAVSQKPAKRAQALELLWESRSGEAREFVRERGGSDAAASVRNTVEALIARSRVERSEHKPKLSLPEMKVDLDTPLSGAARRELHEILHRFNKWIRQQRDRTEEIWKKNWEGITASDIRRIVGQTATHPDGTILKEVEIHSPGQLLKSISTWAKRDDVALVHLVRLLVTIGWISRDRARGPHFAIWWPAAGLLGQFGRISKRVSLRELEQLFETYDVPAETIAANWFSSWGGHLADGWPDDAIWPYFAAHREVITEAFGPATPHHRGFSYDKRRVFDALATFPVLPADLVPPLLDLALGSGKADRAGAQRVLDRYPDKVPHIIRGLVSGKADTRMAAADWLARLGEKDAVTPLEAALEKEKHPGAAGAIMSALQSLGVPVDRFLNREGLLKEAQAGLGKGIPAALQWFPFHGLPALEWADTGESVPEEVARWWIVQSFKLKSPEPNGVLRQYFGSLRPASREAFALYVLRAWLSEDVKPISQSEAEKHARAEARQTLQLIRQFPQHYQKAMTEQQLYEACLPQWLRRPSGSAASSKGVLAVVAAGGGSEVAPVVHRYLKEWYGTRASQGKSLIRMLAWVDHPTATQLVLSIGSRFRTKSFQQEATRQAQLLAERRNWTIDELADRTIPTAGFDADGMAGIDYGARRFTARLTADFGIELFSPEGKPVASLPGARKDEDADLVKQAKKQWTAAKKELKDVLQLQKDRLYEALCTERTWTSEDWNTYLNRHPIVRRYCQRLVWIAKDKDRQLTFRPLDDGSLTDVDDNAVQLDSSVPVSIAHDTNLPAAEGKRWLEHLEDYKVDPLFQQFGKGVHRLPDGQEESTEIDDFQGHVLEAFALRGRATKLGYSRGAAEDGGWFLHYEKRFATLGIEAHIDFTGNLLPEENRRVALLALSFAFAERGQFGEGQVRIALSRVPKVLLSECWNDMRLMAAEGPGFDPDWQKKTEY